MRFFSPFLFPPLCDVLLAFFDAVWDKLAQFPRAVQCCVVKDKDAESAESDDLTKQKLFQKHADVQNRLH